MENYNRESSIFSAQTVENIGSRSISKHFISNVFMWMFAGLGISTVLAVLFATNLSLLTYLFDLSTGKMNALGWVVMLAPIGFVMLMSYGYQRLSAPAIAGLFVLYSAINGISFSFILLQYTSTTVIGCFASAAAMFGIMAVMGYTTDKDLTSFGRILTMGLLGVVVALLINFFLHSSVLDYIVSIIGVMVFTGLTAYDVQKLKRIGAGIEFQGAAVADTRKLAVMGALNLYLDFVNIFLFLLRLFGGGRKD